MGSRLLGKALAFALAIGVSGNLAAQERPAAAKPAVAASFDPHDLSGAWMQDRSRPGRVIERYWICELSPDEPPMTLWGLAQFLTAKSSFGSHAFPIAETNDPTYKSCSPPGFPRAIFHAFPLQIMQTAGEVIMVFEWDSMRHQIFTDGRKHDEALGPLWMGDSIGNWEGDTLVADTVNFNDKTWLDRIGHPHSEQLHVVVISRATGQFPGILGRNPKSIMRWNEFNRNFSNKCPQPLCAVIHTCLFAGFVGNNDRAFFGP
jgi:hypothetical protein